MPALPALPQADLLQPGGYPFTQNRAQNRGLTSRFVTPYSRYIGEEPARRLIPIEE
jgi:hypothetical protein